MRSPHLRQNKLVKNTTIDLVSNIPRQVMTPSNPNHFGCFQQSFSDVSKSRLSTSSVGYRNKEGYKKVNQSTSTIQMRSSLSNFQDSFFIPLNRRKQTTNTYQKSVNEFRNAQEIKETSKILKWERHEGNKDRNDSRQSHNSQHRQAKLNDMLSMGTSFY